MDEKYIKLTSAIYRLFDFFPDQDPLKNRAKNRLLSISDNLVLFFKEDAAKLKIFEQLLEDIDILRSYLKLAKMQVWITDINFLIADTEFKNLKNELAAFLPKEKVEQKLKAKPRADLTERQKKIVKLLQEKNKAQVLDFLKVLPDVTKRTIRRDLDDLLKKQVVERQGEWNEVFYVMHGNKEIGQDNQIGQIMLS